MVYIPAYQQPRTPQPGPHPSYSYHPHEMRLPPADPSVVKRPSDMDYLKPRKSSLPSQQASPAKSKIYKVRPPVVAPTGSPPPLPPRAPRQLSQQTQQLRPPAVPPSGSGQRVKQNDPWSNWVGSSSVTSSPTAATSGGGLSHPMSYLSPPTAGKVKKFPMSPR